MGEITIGSLFTGAGALCELAVAPLLGGRVVWHCENDTAAGAVLAYRFPGTPNLGDITVVDWSSVEPVAVLVGGFPCPDISSAGRKVGIEGERSGLWSHFADAIRVLRPRLVLVENVADLVVRGLDRVLADLAALGFDAEWAVVRASDVGTPHRRARTFIAAADATGPRRGSLEPLHVSGDIGETDGIWATQPRRRYRAVADPDGGRHHGRRGAHDGSRVDRDAACRTDTSDRAAGDRDWGIYAAAIRRWERVLGRPVPDPTVTGRRGGRRLNSEFAEWMMGWPAGWATDVPGLTSNEQLRLCGNGVVPQQIQAAMRYLLPVLSHEESARHESTLRTRSSHE